ncbi:MAG: hypothetical protein U5K51_03515 [Flavobacteriaceae bacterium]|nr:hypothetical protein [Flavobacteriaceae bacterium]
MITKPDIPIVSAKIKFRRPDGTTGHFVPQTITEDRLIYVIQSDTDIMDT